MDYVLLTPGPAIDVAAMISVKGSAPQPKGSLFLTTVYSDMDATVAKLIQSKVGGNALVLPKREFIPPSMSMDEYSKLILDMMDESKIVAKIVALRQLGYDVEASGEGARVEMLLPGTMAEGILAEGDIVVAANSQQIHTATDLVNLVRRQKPGDEVSLTVTREGRTFDTRVGTKDSDGEPGIAVIGILIKTYLFGHNLPVEIDIDSENIGGPSAGLMFALGIVDALDEGSLTSGHKVAGTGTISLDGSVGPVGGVAQKTIGAERAGAEYLLASKDNIEEARGAARGIQVIQADTIDDAVAFLKTLEPSATGAGSLLLPSQASYPVAPAA